MVEGPVLAEPNTESRRVFRGFRNGFALACLFWAAAVALAVHAIAAH